MTQKQIKRLVLVSGLIGAAATFHDGMIELPHELADEGHRDLADAVNAFLNHLGAYVHVLTVALVEAKAAATAPPGDVPTGDSN